MGVRACLDGLVSGDGVFVLSGVESRAIVRKEHRYRFVHPTTHAEFPLELDLFPLAPDGSGVCRNRGAVGCDRIHGIEDASRFSFGRMATISLPALGGLCLGTIRKPVVAEPID